MPLHDVIVLVILFIVCAPVFVGCWFLACPAEDSIISEEKRLKYQRMAREIHARQLQEWDHAFYRAHGISVAQLEQHIERRRLVDAARASYRAQYAVPKRAIIEVTRRLCGVDDRAYEDFLFELYTERVKQKEFPCSTASS